jgi:hypothetical protein
VDAHGRVLFRPRAPTKNKMPAVVWARPASPESGKGSVVVQTGPDRPPRRRTTRMRLPDTLDLRFNPQEGKSGFGDQRERNYSSWHFVARAPRPWTCRTRQASAVLGRSSTSAASPSESSIFTPQCVRDPARHGRGASRLYTSHVTHASPTVTGKYNVMSPLWLKRAQVASFDGARTRRRCV